MALSKTTKDHDEIRSWAEERGAKPSHVKATESTEDIGILRLDFPGFSGADSLEEISWDDFFEKFDQRNLALVYQEKTADGERSNFNKIISGDSVETDEDDESESRSTPAKKNSRGAKKAAAPAAKSSSTAAKKGAAPGRKTATKQPAPQKSTAKQSVSGRKTAAKVPAKKLPAKKVPAKKVPAKKTTARGASVKNSPVKKTAAKKVPAKKTSAKKATTKSTRGRR